MGTVYILIFFPPSFPLSLRLFQEVLASSDPVALNLFYHQAVDDIGKGRIPCDEELAALKSFKAQGKKKEVGKICH